MYIIDELLIAFSSVPAKTIWNELRGDESLKDWFEEDDRGHRSLKKFIETYIDERWSNIREDLPLEAETVDGRLVVYRCIDVRNQQAFVDRLKSGKVSRKHPGLGIFWTWHRESAECHWGSGTGNDVILKALVDLTSIDTEMTLLANFNPSSGLEEKEIRLWDKKPVTLVEVCLLRPWQAERERLLGCHQVGPLELRA